MENNLIDDIIASANNELGFNKEADNKNGAPENPTNAGNNNQDIVSIANSFLQEIEQFKQSLAAGAAGGGEQNPGVQQTDPNSANTLENPQGTDPNMGATGPNGASSGITVQTPGGSVVKIASLVKLAALKGKSLFSEVK